MAQMERLLVSYKELRGLGVPYSRAHVDRLERVGDFPRRIKLGKYRGARVVWRLQDVLDWLAAREQETQPLLPIDDSE